jgi:hypothetical protein
LANGVWSWSINFWSLWSLYDVPCFPHS